MKNYLLSIWLLCTLPLFSQDITGIWYGYPDLRTHRLRLTIELQEQKGAYSATLKIPDQSDRIYSDTKVNFINNLLTLEFPEFENRVLTDEKWLGFAVEQLLSNALKYTKTGTITISMDENDVLTIRDTGIGISAEDLPRICERGFTGFNGRQEKTSSGLGLYLTRQILKKLSTPMEITSEPGKGTQVRLFLHKEKMKHF